MNTRREPIASSVLVAAVALVSAGAFGIGWRTGCILTGVALFTALTHLIGNPPKF